MKYLQEDDSDCRQWRNTDVLCWGVLYRECYAKCAMLGVMLRSVMPGVMLGVLLRGVMQRLCSR
jgi:hypothetical protein